MSQWRSFALDSSRLLELQASLLQKYIGQHEAEGPVAEATKDVATAVEQVCETLQSLQLQLERADRENFPAVPVEQHEPLPRTTPSEARRYSQNSANSEDGLDASCVSQLSMGAQSQAAVSAVHSAGQESMASIAESVVESLPSDWESKSELCPSGVLSPHWWGKLVWDFLVMFLVLMDATVLPFQLTFKTNAEEDDFDEAWLWITTLIFAFDVVLSFNTGVEATEKDVHMAPGTLITQRRVIAKKYLRGWFAIDFGSTVPWSQIAELLTAGEDSGSTQLTRLTKVVKFVRLLRLMRMLRLAKLGAIWERIEVRIGSIFFVQCVALIRVLLVVIGICHWNACIFWLIGLPRNLFTELMSDNSQAEYFNSPHWTTVWRVTEAQADAWRWIDRPMPEKYVFCFYWTLGVMRTMPAEVTPVNLPERLFVLIFMFFALSAFAICVSLITQAFFKISDRRRAFNEELAAVRMHLQKTYVEEQIQLKVKSYLRYIFDRRRIQAKEASLMNILPEQLKLAIRRSQIRTHLDKIPLMRELERDSLEKVIDSIETFDLMQGDEVNCAGSVAEAAWVLVSGRLRVTKRIVAPLVDDSDLDVAPLTVDEHCLEEEGPVLSRYTAIAAESSELLKITKDTFFQSISVSRRKSITLRGTALYYVKKSTSQTSVPDSIGRRRSVTGVTAAVQAAAVISSS
ncbi:unnamed protein product [Effrenium voratum]|uniref:Cyclic nucleotide-binding domain-containing protein n=1 Tax=Effrenium voratum TaxID=2562239 RepID=A0AA36NKB8_9DINO|nr:unnamed protein product [Effrenium voratum]CAJ1407586.1 unnamed protein product [Effrenium voratum]CAJ1428016.1 unnamed protein product [Effrenium voratum]